MLSDKDAVRGAGQHLLDRISETMRAVEWADFLDLANMVRQVRRTFVTGARQDYRLRKDRTLKTVSDCGHEYENAEPHTICVKVIDVVGCDTSTLREVPGAGGLTVTSKKRGQK